MACDDGWGGGEVDTDERSSQVGRGRRMGQIEDMGMICFI